MSDTPIRAFDHIYASCNFAKEKSPDVVPKQKRKLMLKFAVSGLMGLGLITVPSHVHSAEFADADVLCAVYQIDTHSCLFISDVSNVSDQGGLLCLVARKMHITSNSSHPL